MFEIYISLIIFCIFLKIIHKKYFDKNYKEGEWLTVDKDLKSKYFLNWDISNNSCVRIANFRKFRKYFFGKDLYHKLKENSGILMGFKSNNITLDVYDKDMKNLYHIIDPDAIIFSTIKDENHYYLEKDKKYIFFLRSEKKELNYRLLKYKDIRNLDFNIKIENQLIFSVNEDDLYEDFVKRCTELRNSMEKQNFILSEILKSEEYVSFPSNNIANKLTVNSKMGDIMIVVCTNKKETSGMKNHTIEINSKYNNINWEPENKDNISHFILDNSDHEGEIKFFERTTNISKGSNILNFHILIFKYSGNL